VPGRSPYIPAYKLPKNAPTEVTVAAQSTEAAEAAEAAQAAEGRIDWL